LVKKKRQREAMASFAGKKRGKGGKIAREKGGEGMFDLKRSLGKSKR